MLRLRFVSKVLTKAETQHHLPSWVTRFLVVQSIGFMWNALMIFKVHPARMMPGKILINDDQLFI